MGDIIGSQGASVRPYADFSFHGEFLSELSKLGFLNLHKLSEVLLGTRYDC